MRNKELIKLLLEYPLDMEITIYDTDWGDYSRSIILKEEKNVTVVEPDGKMISIDTVAIVV